MGRVQKHDLAQLPCGLRGIYRSGETLGSHGGNQTGVVNVGMGQADGIHICRRDGELTVLINILALLHAAVNENLFPAGLQQGAGAGNLMGCTDKC